MRTRLAAAALACAVAVIPASADAQRWGTVELGAHVQRTFLDQVLQLDDGFGGGVLAGVFLLPNLELIGDMTFTPTTGPRSGDITYRPGYVRGQYNVPLGDRTRLLLGAGYVLGTFSGDTTDNEYEDGVHGLLGLRYYLNPTWSLRVEGIVDRFTSPGDQANATTDKSGYPNYHLRLGLSWQYPPNDRCVVTIEPTTANLTAGETRPFRVTVRGERSGKEWSGATTAYVTDDGAISPAGVYTARTAGRHTVTANVSGRGCRGSAAATVTVMRLEAIAITPKAATVDTGGTARFGVRGRMSDGRDSTGLGVRYGASCGTIDASGAYRAPAEGGTCTVTATVTTADGRTLADTATVTVNAPPPPPPPPVQQPSPIRLVATVYFDLGQATLDAGSRRTLDAIVDSLNRSQGPIHVNGHADTVPPAGVRDAAASRAFNEQLSQRRVDAVIAYLAGRGVPRNRFQPHAYGFCRPVVPSVSPRQQPRGERRNRRAEVSVQIDPAADLTDVCR
jgi:outer membrane protein OmpA-like peptidoglycan-associated protein